MQMNPASKSSFSSGLDPVIAAVMEQLKGQVEAKDRVIAAKDQALAAAEAIIQQLKDALRLERIRKYGKTSEKLSDLQLELLDLEPAVASDEIETEAASGPLPEEERNAPSATQQQQKNHKPHPGRKPLPAHLHPTDEDLSEGAPALERIEQIVPCAPEQCKCGKCGGATRVIGYEETEVLAMKPSVYFVRVLKREKRACSACVTQGELRRPRYASHRSRFCLMKPSSAS
jgi:hypothetical protein